MSASHSQPARELARRLLGREPDAADGPDALSAAVSQACERVLENLSRWVGIDGAAALFARALTHAQAEHPVLQRVRFSPRSSGCLDGIADSAATHGASAVAQGVAGILIALIELLGRLIGDDMAMQLIEQSVPASAPGDAPSTGGENAQ